MRRVASVVPTIAMLALAITALAQPGAAAGPGATVQVFATDARLVREVTGPFAQSVQGVPARPVDSFSYHGRSVREVPGSITLVLDPASDSGLVRTEWSDEHGDWTFRMTTMLHPHHASGLRVGASAGDRELVLKDAVVADVWLHGDTTAGLPVLPTVFAHTAAWGRARVLLNGARLVDPEGVGGVPSSE